MKLLKILEENDNENMDFNYEEKINKAVDHILAEQVS
jgi:hypothetical protein